eukprot:5883434-Lingulodinium_polyedra.AAC.1
MSVCLTRQPARMPVQHQPHRLHAQELSHRHQLPGKLPESQGTIPSPGKWPRHRSGPRLGCPGRPR